MNDPNIETAVSVITAYGSFNLARFLGVSAIICTAIAGIAIGTLVVPRAMSKEVKETLFSFWSVIAYIVNSLVFLSMGLLVNFSTVIGNILLILLALGMVILARAVFVYVHYPISRLASPARAPRIPSTWYNALTLAGIRGAIPVVLALTLAGSALPIPPGVADVITSTVVGVALISITVQSILASWYIKKRFGEQTKIDD